MFVCLAFLSISSICALDLPKGVYEFSKLEEARAEAAKEEKPLCFVVSLKKLKPS